MAMLWGFLGAGSFSYGQAALSAARDSTAPLASLETELKPLADTVLRGEDYPRRLASNEALLARLGRILQRPESYDYPFDSLQTISIVEPVDRSFRIFTWQLVVWDRYHTRAEHYYHGFVQRRYVSPATLDTHYVVIPLQDKVDYAPAVEAEQLTDENWFGALYYKPENSTAGVLTYQGEYAQYNALTDKTKKQDIKYYILLGYNGHTLGQNYKLLDVITFDPQDSSRALFGVPIFQFGGVAKYRSVWRYGDNAHFSLNRRLVVSERFLGLGKKKTLMLVYDNVTLPRKARPSELYAVGADGTQSALYWINRWNGPRKGFFYNLRNVTVYDPTIEGYDPKVIRRQMKEEEKRLRKMGVDFSEFRALERERMSGAFDE